MTNILLIIVDCLRYDRVTLEYMPNLCAIADKAYFYTNCWSVSHCTDPAFMALLAGKWPDELKLYSMMYEDRTYRPPEPFEMLNETAQRCDYHTGLVTNLQRWYKCGADHFFDSHDKPHEYTWQSAHKLLKKLEEPWLLTVHSFGAHTHYRGGSYDRAVQLIDADIGELVKACGDALIVVTADHGEGLGERGIDQHGNSLWPFLTHVPLIVRPPFDSYHFTKGERVFTCLQLTDVHRFLTANLDGKDVLPCSYHLAELAHMVGATPESWHRAVTDGTTMVIRERELNKAALYMQYDIPSDSITRISHDPPGGMWEEARQHAARFGVDADDDELDDVGERLKALGYWE